MIAVDVSKYFSSVIYSKCFLLHLLFSNPANVLILTHIKNQKELFFWILTVQYNCCCNIRILRKRYKVIKDEFLFYK
jgi:hypothetical protein